MFTTTQVPQPRTGELISDAKRKERRMDLLRHTLRDTEEMIERITIGSTGNRAVKLGAKARNNGRYNGNGREWATPPEVFAPLDAEFGFTVDACATPENAKVSRFWTEAENGLAQDWRCQRVWMNPPYGREVYPWTEKARTSGAEIVVGLLPASCDLKWWHDDVVAAGAEVRYIRGRVRFLTGGPYRASGFFASVVVIWRAPNSTLAFDAVGKPTNDASGVSTRVKGLSLTDRSIPVPPAEGEK